MIDIIQKNKILKIIRENSQLFQTITYDQFIESYLEDFKISISTKRVMIFFYFFIF
jgi:hypothetical protein